MKKVLITGSGGFIGRNLFEKWRNKYEVFAPRSTELDLRNEEQVSDYLRKYKFDVVIHAAKTDDVKNQVSSYDIIHDNLRMFFVLEKYQKEYGKMFYFGSGAEYGRDFYIPNMKESYLGTGIAQDPYGFSKYIMAKSCEQSQNIYDIVLFGVYGKYEQYKRRFISNNICRSIHGGPMTIVQNTFFDYLYIDDLCGIMEWLIEHDLKHKRYNVCSGSSIDLLSIAHIINKVTGLNREIIVQKEGLKPEYSGDNTRLKAEMGGFSFTTLEKGIDNLYTYYKDKKWEGQ